MFINLLTNCPITALCWYLCWFVLLILIVLVYVVFCIYW